MYMGYGRGCAGARPRTASTATHADIGDNASRHFKTNFSCERTCPVSTDHLLPQFFTLVWLSLHSLLSLSHVLSFLCRYSIDERSLSSSAPTEPS